MTCLDTFAAIADRIRRTKLPKLVMITATCCLLAGCVSHATTVYRPAPLVWQERPVYWPAPPVAVRPYHRSCYRCW